MTLRHLEVFLTVCKYDSMTTAANELNMSQPAVSMMIKELESYYGVQLFDRMNRKIYLTAPGTILKQYAENILNSYDEVFDLLKENRHEEMCKIGFNVTIGETLMPDILLSIQSHYPNLTLKVIVDNNSEIEKQINENKLDFAFVENIQDEATIKYIPYCKEELVIVCKKGSHYSIHELADLLSYPLLMRETGSGNRNCVDTVFHVYDLKVDPFIESNNDLTLIKAAINNLGLAFISQSLAKEYSNELDLIEISNIHFIRKFYIIYSTKKYLSTSIMKCIQELSNLNF